MPMPEDAKKLIIVAGPTAVGKTAVALLLAQHYQSAILSADSRQCYKGMAIGTAQPTVAEKALVPHYFIDQYPITQELSAADYEQYALITLQTLFQKHNTLIVCGGTGLYIKALCQGLDPIPSVDPAIKQAVEALYLAQGLKGLQQCMRLEDPNYQHPQNFQNPVRLIRALCVKRSTGKSILEYQQAQAKSRPFQCYPYLLYLDRALLYQKINTRVEQMMAQGLLDEVKQLYPFKLLKNLQTVGYSELFKYLDHQCSLEEAIDKIKQHSRNYAKRQMTWFQKEKDFYPIENIDPLSTCQKIIEQVNAV